MTRGWLGQVACGLLVTIMVLSTFIVTISNNVTAAQDGDYSYSVSGSPAVATITGYTGAGGTITLPST